MSNIASESNSISDTESTTTDKSKHNKKVSMEPNEMLEDNLNFNWNDDELQNLGKCYLYGAKMASRFRFY